MGRNANDGTTLIRCSQPYALTVALYGCEVESKFLEAVLMAKNRTNTSNIIFFYYIFDEFYIYIFDDFYIYILDDFYNYIFDDFYNYIFDDFYNYIFDEKYHE